MRRMPEGFNRKEEAEEAPLKSEASPDGGAFPRDLLVLCPTRERPQAVWGAYESFKRTATGNSFFAAIVDHDDPALEEYKQLDMRVFPVSPPSPSNMVKALNRAVSYAVLEQVRYIGFIGDDHRFRTKGWDTRIIETLDDAGGGFAYANDDFQGEIIPTQVFISREIIKALGWMALPTCHHLFIDNAWRVLGEKAGCLFYLQDVVIEHLHPGAGKAKWDAGHIRVNSPAMYEHDKQAFEEWLATSAAADIERVKMALNSTSPKGD